LQALVMEVGAKDESAHIVEGNPPEAASALCRSVGARMLVIGRGSPADGRLRPNAYSIIRQSPCPVLSV
jgi:nucleotide-binding universal stress UspA family protein